MDTLLVHSRITASLAKALHALASALCSIGERAHRQASQWSAPPRQLRSRGSAVQTVRVGVGRGGMVEVQAGKLWITADHHPEDHVLGPGDRLWVPAGQVLRVSAWLKDDTSLWMWHVDQAWAAGSLRRAEPVATTSTHEENRHEA